MAYFAKLDENNVVLEVHCVNNDVLDTADEDGSGIAFLTEWSGGYTNWKKTSYNSRHGVRYLDGGQQIDLYNKPFRRTFAGIGFSYDPNLDMFIDPKPYPSWALNDTGDWESPIPYPSDGVIDLEDPSKNKVYNWNEETLSWDPIILQDPFTFSKDNTTWQ